METAAPRRHLRAGEAGQAPRAELQPHTVACSADSRLCGPHGAHLAAAPGSFPVAFIESDWSGSNCTNIIDINSTPGSIYIWFLPELKLHLIIILAPVVRGQRGCPRRGSPWHGGGRSRAWDHTCLGAGGLGAEARDPKPEKWRLKS